MEYLCRDRQKLSKGKRKGVKQSDVFKAYPPSYHRQIQEKILTEVQLASIIHISVTQIKAMHNI
jgi:hypothetical protein